MPKLPVVSGRKVVKALKKIGFVKVSQKGSHIKMVREFNDPDRRNQVVIIPDHKEIKKGTLRNGILKSIPLSVEEFVELL